MHVPIDAYWAVVKRILRYLKGTVSFGLQITCNSSFTLHDLQMLFGLVMLMIVSQQVVILSILVIHQFLGNQANNVQLLDLRLRLSIRF
jgi:hypothetical protein